MKQITRIIFPTDFSDTASNAFVYALWLADQYCAKIDLWHFVPTDLVPADVPIMSAEITQQRIDLAKDIAKTFEKAALTKLKKKYEMQYEPVVHKYIAIGTPGSDIHEKATDKDRDLIIMGTQGENSSLRKVFGSVTTATIARAQCPILIIPRDYELGYIKTVAYATDFRYSDPFQIWKANKLLKPFSPTIRVFHVEEKPDINERISFEDLRDFFKDLSPNLDISLHSMSGEDTSYAIAQFVDQYDIDLLVMHKPHRSFFDRIFHTSMTRQVVQHIDIPLLVLK